MDIGFAGVGRMGRPMALNLLKAGYRVSVYDPGLADPESLESAGATVVDAPAALGQAALSISMLPHQAAAEELLLGGRGLLSNAADGHCHVLMGTSGRDVVQQLGSAAARAGVALADAPVSGSVSMAETAAISTMVGAEPEVFAAIRPALAAMTRAQLHTGPLGTGTAVKLAVNCVVAALNQSVGESLMLAEAAGVAPNIYYEALESSAAAAPYVAYKRQAYLHPESAPVAAPVSIILKDVTLALELALDRRLRMPAAETCRQVLAWASDAGLAHRDMVEAARVTAPLGHH